MSRSARLIALLLVTLTLGLTPGLALARAGSGSSMGSRGSFTYSAPNSTPTAPYSGAPMQRSMTPRASTGYGGYGNTGYGNRSPFMSGLMGGLLGAGIGGLLFGHGMFGGIGGMASFLGFLLQIFLLVMVVRLLLRWLFSARPVLAGATRFAPPGMDAGAAPAGGGGHAPPSLTLGATDFQSFERSLHAVQAAWSAHDLNALGRLATPEMLGYFADQLADQASRGVRNSVSDIRLDRGDLSQAWSEHGRDYATVAMRFSMIDVTRDATGQVVDGSPNERVSVAEFWTFLRVPGGSWILSAIQQAR